MGAYAATLVKDSPTVLKLSPKVGLLFGTVNITNYNSTIGDVGIAAYFKTVKQVICSGVSSLGYLVRWDSASGGFKCYYPDGAAVPAGTISAGVVAVTAGTAGDAVTNNNGVLNSTGGQDLAVAAQTFTGTAATKAAAVEVANDVNVGLVDYIAIGIMA
jgi:hypothetical protein